MKKIIAVILILGIVILTGCSRIPGIDAQEIPEIPQDSQTESEQKPDDPGKPTGSSEGTQVTGQLSDPSGFEEYGSPKEDGARPPASAPAETAEIPLQSETTVPTQGSQSKPAQDEDYIVIIAPQEEAPTESSAPVQESESSAPVPETTPEPEPTQPPQASEPAPTPEQSAQPTGPEQPTQPAEPEPTPEPTFDVSQWVSFAKSYGQQVGLIYDASATDCWDNPILASSKSVYLERDITSRLERYVRYGYTAFCVWSESLPDGRYNIYIGYA